MILAEQLKCSVPSINAVKDEIIYCSAPATNGWEITGFFVDAATALGTLASAGIAIWVALDARKRVAEERARADKAEHQTRIREASSKVVSAFSDFAEDIESDDHSKFYEVSNAIMNLKIAYDSDIEEAHALTSALHLAHMEILQPIFVGYVDVRMARKPQGAWDRGLKLWLRTLNLIVSKIRNLIDALNATLEPNLRIGLIATFEEDVKLASRSLKASMSNFVKEEL